MSRGTRYLHDLEQIAGELRDTADEMEAFVERLQKDKIALVPLVELRAKYHEFIHHSTTTDGIQRLNRLTESMKLDEELEPEHQLEHDMINANQHALRLCSAMLAVSKMLTGTE
jgi:hypothetical protein